MALPFLFMAHLVLERHPTNPSGFFWTIDFSIFSIKMPQTNNIFLRPDSRFNQGRFLCLATAGPDWQRSRARPAAGGCGCHQPQSVFFPVLLDDHQNRVADGLPGKAGADVAESDRQMQRGALARNASDFPLIVAANYQLGLKAVETGVGAEGKNPQIIMEKQLGGNVQLKTILELLVVSVEHGEPGVQRERMSQYGAD